MRSRKLATLLALALPFTALASDPIAGTWKENRSKAQPDKRSAVVTYETFGEGGVQYSTETGPVYAATLDEKEYAALGPSSATDKVKLKKLSGSSYEITRTRNGRKTSVERVETTAAGKTLKRSVTVYPEHGSATTNVFYYSRNSGAASGGLPYIGQWTQDPARTEYGSEPQPITITEVEGGALKYAFATGTGYTVNLDGTEVPIADSGSPPTMISAHRIDYHTVELTYKRNNEVTNVVRMWTQPDDNKTLVVRVEPHLKGGKTRTSTFYYDRQ